METEAEVAAAAAAPLPPVVVVDEAAVVMVVVMDSGNDKERCCDMCTWTGGIKSRKKAVWIEMEKSESVAVHETSGWSWYLLGRSDMYRFQTDEKLKPRRRGR